ncbi:MAG: HIT domain-containing protein [Dehalococcoidia bacterium]|nr:HIT domain-containing protein [Dehalococcoidia bacterium]
MEYIWAPWRINYILSEKENGCILCQKPKQDRDKENLLLYRGKHNLIMLNLYPYNPGHLMVTPYRHIQSLEAMGDEEMLEHFRLVSRCVNVLKETMHPDGFNMGINLGKVAGAGIDDHIHTHIVPRWNGDTNFLPVISDTRAVPEALAATYDKLVHKFA